MAGRPCPLPSPDSTAWRFRAVNSPSLNANPTRLPVVSPANPAVLLEQVARKPIPSQQIALHQIEQGQIATGEQTAPDVDLLAAVNPEVPEVLVPELARLQAEVSRGYRVKTVCCQ